VKSEFLALKGYYIVVVLTILLMAQQRVIIGKYTKNKPVNMIYEEDPQSIIIKCVIIFNSNKENS
jgi:uncharacterized membrane protein YiaA